MWALIAAKASGDALPSNNINVGKLKESLSENLAISSDASVASAPLGKKEELLFSWTEVNFPKSGPKIPVIANHTITTRTARAKGLRDLFGFSDTAKGPFQVVT